jgi:hypothetical protein
LQPKPSDQSPKKRDDRRILRRNTSRFAPDIACGAQDSPKSSQSPIRDKLPRLSPQLPYSSTDHLQKLIPSCTLPPKNVENSVPYQKSLPVLQPLDVSDNQGPGSTRPYNSANRASSTDNISCTTSSDEIQHPQKMFDTVLDLWVDAKPRTLYHRTRSMPYLPYESEKKSTQPTSVSLVDASEGNFPLSLFPTPPVLMTRKRIPPPLMLRNSPPTSLQSSCDSTPVGTPTTPRFLSRNSPSQSNFGSCKRLHSSRRITSISPPPFSPPNSPLPSPPVCHENNGRPLEYAGRPRLRTAYSSSNLKDALPFSTTHRLTFSDSIQSSLPIKKSRNPRPEGTQRPQACLVSRFSVSTSMLRPFAHHRALGGERTRDRRK